MLGFPSVLGGLIFLPTYGFLEQTKSTLQSLVRTNVLVYLPIRASRQRLQAEIDSNFCIPHRQRLNVLLHKDVGEVLTRCILRDGRFDDLAFKWAMVSEFDPFFELRKRENAFLHSDTLRSGEG